MQPTKAITIVIVALILTGMCGYFLQPTHEEVSKTTYDYKGDLTPSVIYSQIDDWTEYNPLTNVTGWKQQDGTIIPESSTATPYIKDPAIIGYSEGEVVSHEVITSPYSSYCTLDKYIWGDMLNTDQVVIFIDGTGIYHSTKRSSPSQSLYYSLIEGYTTWLWDLSTNTISSAALNEDGYYEADGKFLNNELYQVGVKLVSHSSSGNVYDEVTVKTPSVSDPTFIDPTRFIQVSPQSNTNHLLGEWDNGQVNGVINIVANKSAQFTLEGEESSSSYSRNWYPDANGLNPIGTVSMVFGDESGNRHVTLNMLDKTVKDKYGGVQSTYDLEEVSSVGQHTTYGYTDRLGASWTLDEYRVYVTVAATGETYPKLEYTLYKEEVRMGFVEVKAWLIPSFTMNIPDIPYDYVLVTLDFLNQKFTCKGIDSLTNTLSYTVADYEYPLEIKNHSGSPIELPSSIEKLRIYVGPGETAKVFIDSTVVAVDPNGILWGDPKMPLAYFYPEQMQYDTRVLFNGFVKYGDSITINGTTFPVDNGYLLYTHTVIEEGEEVEVTEQLPLKGMAIDYVKRAGESQFDVTIVFTEKGDYTIEMGALDTTAVTFTYDIQVYNPDTGTTQTVTKTVNTYAGFLVSATGNWYWQSGIYTITTTVSDNIGLDFESANFGLTMTASSLLMLFFMIISTAAMYRFTEIEFCTMDWVVLVCVSFLLLGVAIM